MKKHNQKIRVAAAQIACKPCDIDANLATHRRAIDEARQQGVDVLLFPELSLTGYHVEQNALHVAMTREDPRLIELSIYADEMTIVVGLVEEGWAAQFHNSSAVLDRGKVQFVHRKLNLASYGRLEEDKYFAEGRYLDVFAERAPWISAILICADLWNPGLTHLAALHGAALLLAPVASADDAVIGDFSNRAGWDIVTRFYSTIYGTPLIMANHCGNMPETTFWGGSRILDARGNVLAQAGEEEQVIVADLDYAHVREARFALPTVRDSNLDLIHREINRLSQRIGVPEGLRKS